MQDILLGSRYSLNRKIGEGSFGEIYSGKDTVSHKPVAIKLEPIKTRAPQLEFESKIYKVLAGGTGIPNLHYYGQEANYNVMIIDMLGQSIEDLNVSCGGKLHLKTVLMLADQMISCIEYLHRCHIIHRDIKPDNFMMGTGNNANQVFIIDFGLAKRFEDPVTHRHIPTAENQSLTGTARYASLNAMRGFEQSRRDDLESLGFVLLFLLRGNLPWMGLPAKTQKEKFRKITDVKASVSFESLCQGFPHEFVEYLTAVRALKFTEEPKYDEYRSLFRTLLQKLEFIYDYQYDWVHGLPPRLPIQQFPQPVAMPLPPKRMVQALTQPPSNTVTPGGSPREEESRPLNVHRHNLPMSKARIVDPSKARRMYANYGRRQSFTRNESNIQLVKKPTQGIRPVHFASRPVLLPYP